MAAAGLEGSERPLKSPTEVRSAGVRAFHGPSPARAGTVPASRSWVSTGGLHLAAVLFHRGAGPSGLLLRSAKAAQQKARLPPFCALRAPGPERPPLTCSLPST